MSKIIINALSINPHNFGIRISGLSLLSEFSRQSNDGKYIIICSKYNYDLIRANVDNSFQYIVIPFRVRNAIFRILIEQFFVPFILLKNRNVDLLFIPSNYSCLLCFGIPQVIFIKAALVIKSIRISYYHNYKIRKTILKDIINDILFALTLRKTSGIMVSTNYLKNHLLKNYKKLNKKIKVVPYGLDNSFLEQVQVLSDKEKRKPNKVLFVSSLFPYKNLDKVIVALSYLKKNIQLFVIGKDPNSKQFQKYQHLAKELNVHGQITYLGPLSRDKLIPHYLDSSMFVFPSSIETFGNPILEAYASKLPTIVSNRMPMAEITDGASILIDPDNPIEISTAIEELLNNEKLRNNLVLKGLEVISKNKWEKVAQEHFKFFQEIILENT